MSHVPSDGVLNLICHAYHCAGNFTFRLIESSASWSRHFSLPIFNFLERLSNALVSVGSQCTQQHRASPCSHQLPLQNCHHHHCIIVIFTVTLTTLPEAQKLPSGGAGFKLWRWRRSTLVPTALYCANFTCLGSFVWQMGVR